MNNIIKEFLKERNVEHLYEDFMDLLVCDGRVRRYLARDYERECHRDDVRIELDEMGIKYTDEMVERITAIYEDRLFDLDDWLIVLRETIKDYLKGE